MLKAIFTVSLFVANYKTKKDNDDFYAFDKVSNASSDAIKSATKEFTDMGILPSDTIKIVSARFVECDSGNISHANAYFECEIEGIYQEVLDSTIQSHYQ